MDDLAATVVKAAYEFGPSGLRGAMSEILQEVDKGLIPAISDARNDIARRVDRSGREDPTRPVERGETRYAK